LRCSVFYPSPYLIVNFFLSKVFIMRTSLPRSLLSQQPCFLLRSHWREASEEGKRRESHRPHERRALRNAQDLALLPPQISLLTVTISRSNCSHNFCDFLKKIIALTFFLYILIYWKSRIVSVVSFLARIKNFKETRFHDEANSNWEPTELPGLPRILWY